MDINFRFTFLLAFLTGIGAVSSAQTYDASSGFNGPSPGQVVTSEKRNAEMANLLQAARRGAEEVKAQLPALPSRAGAYLLKSDTWTKLPSGRFAYSAKGGGQLVSQDIRFEEIPNARPIFIFHENRMDDPPCVVPLIQNGNQSVINLEKVISTGSWVKRSDWQKVRLLQLDHDWYMLECLTSLDTGNYALCYETKVVPFNIPQGVMTHSATSKNTQQDLSSGTKVVNAVSSMPIDESPSESRYSNLSIDERLFSPDDDLAIIDRKNGFQELKLGPTQLPDGAERVFLPDIGPDNITDYSSPIIRAFRGATEVTVNGSTFRTGKSPQNLEYFMGGRARAQHGGTNVWMETLADPNAKYALGAKRETVNLYPIDVAVYTLEGPRDIQGVQVDAIGLNYIGKYLAGIIFQYNLRDEPEILATYTAAFGKPHSYRGTYTWTGERVRIQIGEGYVCYTSLPVMQALAGFIPSGLEASNAEAIDSL